MSLKKQTIVAMLAGNLCMSFPVFTRSFVHLPEDAIDFLKGLGIGLILMAFIVEKLKGRATSDKRSRDLQEEN